MAELVEACTDLLVVIGIVFVVAFVEHGEDRLTVPEVRWMGFDVGFQKFKIRFQGNTSQKFWVMLP
jgi:transposase